MTTVQRPKPLDWILSSDVGKKRALTSKPARAIYAALLLFSLFSIFVSRRAVPPTKIFESLTLPHNETTPSLYGRLHLLIPATSSNVDLCKLLLSCQILGYPTPVFINYDVAEDPDPYVQHLGKVKGILNYLESQGSTSKDTEDLVLILDGYDIWFQLRPDVLIKRYYESNRLANERFVQLYGEEMVREHDIRQTVIFGPDKLCWPIDFSRPACWAVPPGSLSPHAFGPQTSSGREEHAQPRWLNSGTIIGPIKDVREVFRATLHAIQTNYVTNSDQYYFAEIFGVQEYARLARRPDLLQERKKETYMVTVEAVRDNGNRAEPDLSKVGRTEYYIGIDHESSMFQTLAFWKQYLTWTRSVDAWLPPPSKDETVPYSSPYSTPISSDIAQSQIPFATLENSTYTSELNTSIPFDSTTPWSEVELLHNVVSRRTPVAIHFTGEKRFRHIWWPRLWFQSHASTLRKSGATAPNASISAEPIEGRMWYNAEPEEAQEIAHAGRGGAWSDHGGWFSWAKLCRAFEKDLFEVPGDELYHPRWQAAEEVPPEPPEQPASPSTEGEQAKDEGGPKEPS